MPYIKVISPQDATGRLEKIYQRVTGPGGQVDNVLQIHSLRPHTLAGHMALYKAVLHHPRNKLPVWFLEAHRRAGQPAQQLRLLRPPPQRGPEAATRATNSDSYEAYRRNSNRTSPANRSLPAEQAALSYASKLTLDPGNVGLADIRGSADRRTERRPTSWKSTR